MAQDEEVGGDKMRKRKRLRKAKASRPGVDEGKRAEEVRSEAEIVDSPFKSPGKGNKRGKQGAAPSVESSPSLPGQVPGLPKPNKSDGADAETEADKSACVEGDSSSEAVSERSWRKSKLASPKEGKAKQETARKKAGKKKQQTKTSKVRGNMVDHSSCTPC